LNSYSRFTNRCWAGNNDYCFKWGLFQQLFNFQYSVLFGN
jgi:hypothetical protein